MTINLFYIGEDFYWETCTMMSSLYECNTHSRYDWGFVQRDIRNGATVNIRPADAVEMMWAKSKAYDYR